MRAEIRTVSPNHPSFAAAADREIVRYIALLAMVKIIPTHYQMIAEYQEEILQSLDDPDISIRMRALELVSAMVS